jgi:hypothetical protein
MGLLDDDSHKDKESCEYVLEEFCAWWDRRIKPLRAIAITGSKGNLEDCRTISRDLFNGFFFPERPGPFKRVAAFVVLGRLFPFLKFRPADGLDVESAIRFANYETTHKANEWLTRAMVRTIPILFAQLEVEINGKRIPLAWKGFPSWHYELEFHEFLRWTDSDIEPCDCDFNNLTQKTKWALARKIMAATLSLEACYYCQGTQKVIPGHNHHDLDDDQQLDLFFDTDLLP